MRDVLTFLENFESGVFEINDFSYFFVNVHLFLVEICDCPINLAK